MVLFAICCGEYNRAESMSIKGIYSMHCWFTAGIPEMFTEHWVDAKISAELWLNANSMIEIFREYDCKNYQKNICYLGIATRFVLVVAAANSLLFSDHLIFNDLLIRSSCFSHSIWLKSNSKSNAKSSGKIPISINGEHENCGCSSDIVGCHQ